MSPAVLIRFISWAATVFVVATCGVTALAGADDAVVPAAQTKQLPPVSVTEALGAKDSKEPPSAMILAQSEPARAKSAEAEDFEILIVQALDQKTDLEVTDQPVAEAIAQLSNNTGIPIEIEPKVFDLLPYGSKTMLSATVHGRPLRESLTALLRPLGLTFQPLKGRLVIGPSKPLFRIMRRATWQELATIERLYTEPWSPQLSESLRFQFQDISAGDASANLKTLQALAEGVGAGPAAEVLEHACQQHGWTWYPSGEYVAVLTKTRQVERQLETLVSLRYDAISLSDALLDLTGKAGVLLRMDPGVLASLPPQTAEQFSLSIRNATVRQVLEVIAGQTGLGYFIEPDGIRLTSNTILGSGTPSPIADQVKAATEAAMQALRSNSIVGYITVPNQEGASFSFFIRENDLPADVNEMRKAKIHNAAETIRKALLAEQPKN